MLVAEPVDATGRLSPPDPGRLPRAEGGAGLAARENVARVGQGHAGLPGRAGLLHYLPFQEAADGPAQVGAVGVPQAPAQPAQRQFLALGVGEGLADAVLQGTEAPAHPRSPPSPAGATIRASRPAPRPAASRQAVIPRSSASGRVHDPVKSRRTLRLGTPFKAGWPVRGPANSTTGVHVSERVPAGRAGRPRRAGGGRGSWRTSPRRTACAPVASEEYIRQVPPDGQAPDASGPRMRGAASGNMVPEWAGPEEAAATGGSTVSGPKAGARGARGALRGRPCSPELCRGRRRVRERGPSSDP